MKGASFGGIMGCNLLVFTADLSDHAAVIAVFLIQFVILSLFWVALSPRQLTEKQVKKQNRFQTIEEFEAEVTAFDYSCAEKLSILAFFAIALASMAFGSVASGIVFMLAAVVQVPHGCQISITPSAYKFIRLAIAGISVGFTMYFYSFG